MTSLLILIKTKSILDWDGAFQSISPTFHQTKRKMGIFLILYNYGGSP